MNDDPTMVDKGDTVGPGMGTQVDLSSNHRAPYFDDGQAGSGCIAITIVGDNGEGAVRRNSDLVGGMTCLEGDH